jgi:CheY-like chemotaxis protein
VLIVDDHEETREMYAWCMRAGGWVVEEACWGADALLHAAAFHPDVVVLDLQLPGLSGLDVARHLKQDPQTMQVPIVACTGMERSQAEGLAFDAGCDAVVIKPFEPKALRELLEDLATRRKGSCA